MTSSLTRLSRRRDPRSGTRNSTGWIRKRHSLQAYYSDFHGFFVGDSPTWGLGHFSWNLRAWRDTDLWFVDLGIVPETPESIPEWGNLAKDILKRAGKLKKKCRRMGGPATRPRRAANDSCFQDATIMPDRCRFLGAIDYRVPFMHLKEVTARRRRTRQGTPRYHLHSLEPALLGRLVLRAPSVARWLFLAVELQTTSKHARAALSTRVKPVLMPGRWCCTGIHSPQSTRRLLASRSPTMTFRSWALSVADLIEQVLSSRI